MSQSVITRSASWAAELGAPADAAGAPAAVQFVRRDDSDFVLETVSELAEAKGLIRICPF
jgi:hypothetical protein